MGEVTAQSHNVGLTSYWLTSLSFHVNRSSHSWDTAFLKFDLENQGSCSLVRSQFKVKMRASILSTHILFDPCQSALPFLRYSTFKIWPWKSKVKVICEVTVQIHKCGSRILSTHIPFVPCWSALPFYRYSIFKIWPWKSRVKVMGGVIVKSHNMDVTSYRLTSFSFNVNRPSHSWDTAFSKVDLENKGSRSNDPNVAQLQV